MNRKIFIILEMMVLFLLMPLTAEAKNVTVTSPAHTVTINGVAAESICESYPLLMYENITYLPLTDTVKKYVGLEATFYENVYRAERKNVWFVGLADREAIGEISDKKQTSLLHNDDAQVVESLIAMNMVLHRDFYDNQRAKYPLLSYHDMIYLPLTYQIAVNDLGWEYVYDEQNGLILDTTDPIRPRFRSDIIPTQSPHAWIRYQQYAYYPDGYLGYPNTTFAIRSWQLEYKQKGQPSQWVDMSESLAAVMKKDIDFYEAESHIEGMPQPWIEDGKAHIFCKEKGSDQDLLMTVDMENGDVTLTPWAYPDTEER